MKYFALSFDLEEFDIPLEYGLKIDSDDMLDISLEGTKGILKLLEKYRINATFFVTTGFYQKFQGLVNELSKKYEICAHGEHSKNYSELKEDEILNSINQNKALLERGTKTKVVGFRAPRMLTTNHYGVLARAGIKYDASLHPTYIPGRYNNFFAPRKIVKKNGVIVVPTSVVPLIRVPFTWLWFRNFGLAYAKFSTELCFLTDSYVNIYFHPWEFIPLKKWGIPLMFKRNTGNVLYRRLGAYIKWLLYKKKVKFVTLNELAEKFS